MKITRAWARQIVEQSSMAFAKIAFMDATDCSSRVEPNTAQSAMKKCDVILKEPWRLKDLSLPYERFFARCALSDFAMNG